MFRKFKEIIKPTTWRYPTLDNLIPPVNIYFKKVEESVSFYRDAVLGNTSQISDKPQRESLAQQFQDGAIDVLKTISDSILAPVREMVPGIYNPDDLKNLTDMRTADEGLCRMLDIVNDKSQTMLNCNEQPRPFVYEDFKTKDLTKRPSMRRGKGRSRKELEIQKMINHILNQRDLRAKKLKEKINQVPPSYIADIDTVIKQEEKIWRPTINLFDLSTEKIKDTVCKNSIIDIDTVLKSETKLKEGKYTGVKTSEKDKMNLNKTTIDSFGKNYLNEILKKSMMEENKTMRATEKRVVEETKNQNAKPKEAESPKEEKIRDLKAEMNFKASNKVGSSSNETYVPRVDFVKQFIEETRYFERKMRKSCEGKGGRSRNEDE